MRLTKIFAALTLFSAILSAGIPRLTVGYVAQDHHTALFVAALHPERTRKDAGLWLEKVEEKKQYKLMENGRQIAELSLVQAPGGGKMMTLLAQGQFDVSLGGVAAMANSVDKGGPIAVIAPLHTRGNMLVTKTGIPAADWKGFVSYVKKSEKPLRIGYKDPVSVARIIFEKGLAAEGIAYADGPNPGVKIVTVNMKGEEFLNPGIQNGLIDGYVSNNPWCAIAEEKGVGKCVADLDELPPGTWKDHPCCAIAGTKKAIVEKQPLVKSFLKLMILATSYMEKERKVAEKAASFWLGTSAVAEQASIASSGFGMRPTAAWKNNLAVWVDEMNAQNRLTGALKGKKLHDNENLLFQFGPLESAYAELEKKGLKRLP